MRDFHYISYAQEVIFVQAGLIRMGEALKHFGWQRLMLCTNRSMRSNGHAAALEAVLGDRLVATLEFLNAINAMPDWGGEYVSAMESALGDAYTEPASDVRGFVASVKSAVS